jgi:membrane protease YdiL (CAAX protease family)
MTETPVPASTEAAESPSSAGPPRRRRLLALGLVLSVSLTHFIVGAFYYLFHPEGALDRYRSQIGVVGALIAELTSLLVLWFVLTEHKRTWREIGWQPRWRDVPHGVFLILASRGAARLVTMIVQGSFLRYTGHYLQARSIHGVTGAGISVFTIMFVFVNPLFEELIVRGYTMSEVTALGGSRNFAIFVSVLLQMSYHVYQGLLRAIGLTAVFLVFSIYFSRERRIIPIVIAHFWSDALALIRTAY